MKTRGGWIALFQDHGRSANRHRLPGSPERFSRLPALLRQPRAVLIRCFAHAIWCGDSQCRFGWDAKPRSECTEASNAAYKASRSESAQNLDRLVRLTFS